ncbi:MAG TPA: AI-2E family transporter [Methylophilaceae bacterium]|nr:AI-2E family transporter [Methylophilaceae bacterium]
MTPKQENVLPDYRLILVTAALLVLVYLLLPILPPFLTGAILAYICSPLVDKLDRIRLGNFRLGRTLSTIIVLVLLLSVMIILLLIVVPLLQKELLLVMQRMPAYLDTLRSRLEPWLLQHFGVTLAIDLAQVQSILTQNWKSASNFVGKLLLQVSTHGIALIGWITNLLLVPVVLFYLLRDWHGIMRRFAELIPRDWYAKTVTIAREIDLVLAEFLRGQLSVMVLMGAFLAAGLWLTGLELAIPIGIIAGLLGFVPYLGPTLGILLAMLAGALQFASLGQLIPVVGVFIAGQALESMVLTPWLVGDRIGLHPVIVIFALLAGGQLFGFTGILLALPAGAAIAVGLRHVKQRYLVSDLYLK